MHAEKVSHKILFSTCAWMHTTRLIALNAAVLAAISDRRLSVTGLGRAIQSDAKEKNCIKRADRLIGNHHLYAEHRDIYHLFANMILGGTTRPVILVDWSDLDPNKRHYLLRASVAVEGRCLTLYQEVHGLDTKEKPKTHRRFLQRLNEMLSKDCRPIVVTDAGFRNPWFREIAALGWDYVGRLRNRTHVKKPSEAQWTPCKQLYERASTTARSLGEYEIAKSSPLKCRLVLYKGKPKGRSKMTCNGERARSKHSEQCAEREREPWLLVTSLPVTSKLAKKVVAIYSTRMQIEESFRDVKSVRFGIGFELNGSRSAKRLQILLLIGMLANVILWILGMVARITEQHWQYQANTVKHRPVLSAIYLGLRVANDRRFSFQLNDILLAAKTLHETVREHGDGW